MEELQEDFKILIDAFISSDNEDTEVLAKSLYKQAEKAFSIQRVSFPLFDNLYSQFVQMDDRFESVHIWSEAHALKNKGRWTPIAISKETYLKEMQHSWNNGS